MSGQEQLLFWQLAYYFINQKNYRLLQLNEDRHEMWLETTNKKANMIRIVAADIDWSNWLRRDIQFTGEQSERLRRHLFRRELHVLNLYISPYPPVDDYEMIIEKPLSVNNNKTMVRTMLLTRESREESLSYLESMFQDQIHIHLPDELTEIDVQHLKQTVIGLAKEKIKLERSMFEHSKPFFTYLFIAIQVIMFFIVESAGGSTDVETLIAFGAKYNPLIIAGEWWRFFTPIILHIGLLHLLMNTLALFYLGSTVERMFGRVRFLWIYLFSGFAGSLASFVFSSNLSAGASGAIFGCFGALLYIGVVNPRLFFRTMGINVLVLVGINLVFGFTVPGIDNAGHIGGLIGGLLATGIVHFPKKRKIGLQFLFLISAAVITIWMLDFGFKNDRPEVINAIAQEHIQNNNLDEAYQILSDFILTGEADAVTYFQLAYVEIQDMQLDKAKENLERAVDLQPEFHEAHFNLAIIYSEEGNIEKAKEHAEIAYDLSADKNYEEFIRELDENG